jgi:hypothetical protein
MGSEPERGAKLTAIDRGLRSTSETNSGFGSAEAITTWFRPALLCTGCLLADVYEDDVFGGTGRAVLVATPRVDIALDRLEALPVARLEHADVVVAAPEVRAVPVEADEIARLRLERHGQAIAARARIAY